MSVPATDELDLDFVKKEPTDLWVSVLLPSLRNAPDRRAGSTQLANLLREANELLEQRGLGTDRLAPARALVEDTGFWLRQSEGIALYISDKGMHTFRVPVTLAPSVTIGQVPRLRPIVPAMLPERTYYLLQLAKKQIRLFEVSPEGIQELDRGPIPGSMDDVEGDREGQERVQFATASGGGALQTHGADSGAEEAADERFLREVARTVEERLGRREPAVPLVLACTEEVAADFRAVCGYPGMTDVTVTGSADGMTANELFERARPVLDRHRADKAQRRSERLQELRAGTRLEDDPLSIVSAAEEARIDALLVGAMDGETNGDGPDDDIVDRAILATLRGGGRVLPMPETTTDTLIGVLRY